MRVWIDQYECMGAGTCEEITPLVFSSRDDGVWVVKEDNSFFEATTVFDGQSGSGHGPDGESGSARVPSDLASLVLDAADECPAECIYVEV